MTNMQLDVTSEERVFLAHLLETALKNKQIEEHRTRAPGYRQHLLREEELIESLIQKLNEPATV